MISSSRFLPSPRCLFPTQTQLLCSSPFSFPRHRHRLLHFSPIRPFLRRCFSSLSDDVVFADGLLRKKSSKVKTFYVCDHCGESYSQWWGRCSSCKMQGSLKKFTQKVDEGLGGGPGIRAADFSGSFPEGKAFAHAETTEPLQLRPTINSNNTEKHQTNKPWLNSGTLVGPRPLGDISRGDSELGWKIPLVGLTGMEISRVLGGGLAPGSLILVGGDPGVGKSTLLLQLSGMLAEGCEFYEPAPVLYVSGEESEEQICSRADRIGISSDKLYLYSASDLEVIMVTIRQLRPRAVIIDSIQTIYLSGSTGSAGGVIQVRECAAALLRTAKQTNIPIFLVGHVTRSGDIAGPRVLEHIVDVVLYLEGENRLAHRILRVVKNRYGSTDEVGVFEMAGNGMVAVENPSQLFLYEREEERNAFSGAIAVTMEGSRPFLVEIQALCSETSNVGKHNVNGLDPQRLHLILAVLSKLTGVKVQNQSVLISVVGGLQVKEPAVDLAVAVAICSSYYDRQIPADMAFIGEIGLGGEIRSVRQLDKRILEVSKLGFQTCIVPKVAQKASKACASESLNLIACATLQEVICNIILQSFSMSSDNYVNQVQSI